MADDYQLVPVDHDPFAVDPGAVQYTPVDHDPFSDRLAQIGRLRDAATPEWAKPFAGMTPQQERAEAQALANPNAKPGKIGPGYLSDTQRIGSAAVDVISTLLPELKAAGLAVKGMSAALPAAKLAGEAAEEAAPKVIRAYHGSPYDFDKFDISKIGTGEGAQAYGHGLYFAENEDVAQGYRRNLSSDAPEVRAANDAYSRALAGRMTGRATDEEVGAARAARDTAVQKAGRTYQVSINADPEHFLDWDKSLSEQSEHAQSVLKEFGPRAVTNEEAAKLRPDMGRRLDAPYYVVDKSGHLAGYYDEKSAKEAADLAGQKIQNYVGEPAVTQKLREAGIPGIKYLDQGSRFQPQQIEHLNNQISQLQDLLTNTPQNDAKRPSIESALAGRRKELSDLQPSHNYVVFDDSLIDIVKKYGIAGIGALPAMGAYHFQTSPVDHDPFKQ